MVLGSMLALIKLKISLTDLRKECDEGAKAQWLRP